MTTTNSYNGNPYIKRDGVQQHFTAHEIVEYRKCIHSISYFAEHYVKVINLDHGLVNFKLRGYQEQMVDHFSDNRFTIVLACRQSGKSVTSVAWLLHYAIFNPDKKIGILANKGATAREMLARITLMLENLPFFLQPGCKVLNKGNIIFSNNSEIIAAATSGSSIRGLSMNVIFLDEFAFVQRANEFYTSTYPVISSGKETKVIITSTPNGVGNMFYKLWEGAIQSTNEFKPFTIRWNDVPGRDEEWKRQTISNTSELQFQQEYSCLGGKTKITLFDTHTKSEIELTLEEMYNSQEILPGRYRILTDVGFKDFDGISCQKSNDAYHIIGESNNIVATSNHIFKTIDGDWITVKDIDQCTKLWKDNIVDIRPINSEILVYDILNVDETHSFIANDLVSHNCDFIGSSQTLISSATLLGLQARDPLKTQYGINYFIEPLEGHDYIMTVDVSKGRGQDYSTFNVIDISGDNGLFKQVCTYRDNMISPLMFPELIVRGAKAYNNALVIIENNDAGQVVCNSVYHDYEYDNTFVQSSVKASGIGVTMTKRVKRIGCSNLKDLVEAGKLEIHDANTIAELSSFEPKGDSFAARGNTHDDLVMNLVLFAWFVSTDAFGGMSSIELKELLYSEKIKEMEEDLPFPLMTSSESYSTPSMTHHQQEIDKMSEWNML